MPETTTPPPPSTYTPPASQDELNRIIESRLARERERYAGFDDLKAKAERLDQIEEQNKTELQKVQEALTAAQQRAAQAEQQAARATVAQTKGVPAALLTGTTQAELEASADALLAFRGTTTPTAPPATPAPISALTPGQGAATEKSVAAGAAMFNARKNPQPKE